MATPQERENVPSNTDENSTILSDLRTKRTRKKHADSTY